MKKQPTDKLDTTLRHEDLPARQGKDYWRSLEELADTPEFRKRLAEEFPQLDSFWDMPVDRRSLLKLMGASLALAGITGCERQPKEEIVPYVRMPEQIVPGQPLYFATALTRGGYAQGVLVESHLGRPTKVEGNELHPASLGATDIFSQAGVLSLYDPDRSQLITEQGNTRGWTRFVTPLVAKRQEWQQRQGEGLHVLTETVTSPTLGRQLEDLLTAFPRARWHQYDPVNRNNVRLGAQLAFGDFLETLFRFDRAKIILSLDGDFLAAQPGHVRYAHDFMERRRVRVGHPEMNRLYVIEATLTLTGAMADHRRALPAGRTEALTRVLANKLGVAVATGADKPPVEEAWLNAVVKDLLTHQGESLVLAGDHQPPAVHALVHAINERLGNIGRTVIHTEPVEVRPIDQQESLRTLVSAMAAGQVDTLVILGGNPAYDTPADVNFTEHLNKVPLSIHWGLYYNETASHCRWHVPATHELESWGDARAYDGTVTLLQPLIAPLYANRSIYEMMALLLGNLNASGYEVVKAYWRERYQGAEFELFWRQALHDGLITDTAASPRKTAIHEDLARLLPKPEPYRLDHLELQFRPDPTVWDGRYANNGWLQELPKPLTKLTWGNAALLSHATAQRLALANEEVIELHYQGRRLQAPVWIAPGQAEETLTLHLGYGREAAGKVGSGYGVNAYRLRTLDAPWFNHGLTIQKLEEQVRMPSVISGLMTQKKTKRRQLVSTQRHYNIEGRELVRVMTQEAFRQSPHLRGEPPEVSLYPEFRYESYAWGMVIDLNACIGCNTCVVACQAENNIPIVGKEEVARGREMHWLRVDRYYKNTPANPETYFQPVPCMQCEKAPCEPVCPVEASIHDAEGINNQVYNRCIGTRFCEANCPYKVRRFNFFDYADREYPYQEDDEVNLIPAQRNPDVTVRSRGVMEKCTYCIQRINQARITAQKENRRIRDGEVVTACQGACPTQAISFGDISDPDNHVAKLKMQPHHYVLLEELNTRPRTTYLAKLRNPNPELKD